MAHDPRIVAGAFNHVSPYFADVVWRGLSTRHVRAGLEGHVTLEDAARVLDADQPVAVHRSNQGSADAEPLRYLRPDVPVDLSRHYLDELDAPADSTRASGVLPCGHYTSGRAPFKFLVGYHLTKFLATNL